MWTTKNWPILSWDVAPQIDKDQAQSPRNSWVLSSLRYVPRRFILHTQTFYLLTPSSKKRQLAVLTQIYLFANSCARAICYLSSERVKANFSIFPPIWRVPGLAWPFPAFTGAIYTDEELLVTLTSSGSKWPMLAADLAALGSELSVRLSLAPPSSLDGWNLRHTNLEQQRRVWRLREFSPRASRVGRNETPSAKLERQRKFTRWFNAIQKRTLVFFEYMLKGNCRSDISM